MIEEVQGVGKGALRFYVLSIHRSPAPPLAPEPPPFWQPRDSLHCIILQFSWELYHVAMVVLTQFLVPPSFREWEMRLKAPSL
jgi:hypothetical protein